MTDKERYDFYKQVLTPEKLAALKKYEYELKPRIERPYSRLDSIKQIVGAFMFFIGLFILHIIMAR